MYENGNIVKQRFATRKLKTGLVSVLLRFSIFFGMGVDKYLMMPVYAETTVFEEGPYGVPAGEYEEKYAYYNWSKSVGNEYEYYFDKEYVENAVKVEKIGEEKDGVQEWKIIFNQRGIYVDPYGNEVYTENPRFGFVTFWFCNK